MAMNVIASESSSPIGEPQAAERRKRLRHLAWMVFNLMRERFRFLGGINHEFDGVEDAGLIDALRACSHYTQQIACSNYDELYVIQVNGIDGHVYIIQFLLFAPGISVHAARVRVTSLPLVGQDGQVDSTYNTMDVLQEYSKRLKLGKVTIDRAFLIGMSLVISFMDDQDDDPDEDARLAPLTALVMPTEEELREIWAKKLPPSTINYDDEGDQPF
jgi:hypothetical protein